MSSKHANMIMVKIVAIHVKLFVYYDIPSWGTQSRIGYMKLSGLQLDVTTWSRGSCNQSMQIANSKVSCISSRRYGGYMQGNNTVWTIWPATLILAWGLALTEFVDQGHRSKVKVKCDILHFVIGLFVCINSRLRSRSRSMFMVKINDKCKVAR